MWTNKGTEGCGVVRNLGTSYMSLVLLTLIIMNVQSVLRSLKLV